MIVEQIMCNFPLARFSELDWFSCRSDLLSPLNAPHPSQPAFRGTLKWEIQAQGFSSKIHSRRRFLRQSSQMHSPQIASSGNMLLCTAKRIDFWRVRKPWDRYKVGMITKIILCMHSGSINFIHCRFCGSYPTPSPKPSASPWGVVMVCTHWHGTALRRCPCQLCCSVPRKPHPRPVRAKLCNL